MNQLAEKIAAFLGSAWVIGVFGLWTIVHAFITRDYVATISDLAIEIGFLILRAESVAAARQEKYTKQAVKDTKKDLDLSRSILKVVKEHYVETR